MDKILSEVSGAAGTLIFNNPERHNAVSLDMWREATAVLANFENDPAIRVVIVRGAGSKAFISGADISKFESERSGAEAVNIYNAAVEKFARTLLEYPKPTIAMIRGYCIGGGLGTAVCCDMRIANEKARFGIPAAKLGLGYGFDNVGRILSLVAPQFAAEMLFTARQFDASEALRIGLVNRIIPDAEIEDYVRDLAETIASNAPLTIRAAKRILQEWRREPEHRDLAACERLVNECFESADYQEGRRAFTEKRRPVFTGK